MIVQKRIGGFGWLLVGGTFVMIGFLLVSEHILPAILGFSLFELPSHDLFRNIFATVILTVYFLIAAYASVLLALWVEEKKKINFYTSKRFRTERKVLLVLIVIFAILNLIGIMLDVSSGEFLDSGFLAMTPVLIYLSYFLIYKFSFFLGLRKNYYDDLDD